MYNDRCRDAPLAHSVIQCAIYLLTRVRIPVLIIIIIIIMAEIIYVACYLK